MQIRTEVQVVIDHWRNQIIANSKKKEISFDRDQIECFTIILGNELETFLQTEPNLSSWHRSLEQRNPALGRLNRMLWAAAPTHCNQLTNALKAAHLASELLNNAEVIYLDPNNVMVHPPYEPGFTVLLGS